MKKNDFLIKYNYKGDHNNWSKIELINFLVVFKPEIKDSEKQNNEINNKKDLSKKDRIAELEKELAKLKEEE